MVPFPCEELFERGPSLLPHSNRSVKSGSVEDLSTPGVPDLPQSLDGGFNDERIMAFTDHPHQRLDSPCLSPLPQDPGSPDRGCRLRMLQGGDQLVHVVLLGQELLNESPTARTQANLSRHLVPTVGTVKGHSFHASWTLEREAALVFLLPWGLLGPFALLELVPQGHPAGHADWPLYGIGVQDVVVLPQKTHCFIGPTS